MTLRALFEAAAIVTAVLAMAGPSLAHVDPNQTCTPPRSMTDWGVPIGSRVTCFNADGSYQVCTSLETAGNGELGVVGRPVA